jgi:hypothetical protein
MMLASLIEPESKGEMTKETQEGKKRSKRKRKLLIKASAMMLAA